MIGLAEPNRQPRRRGRAAKAAMPPPMVDTVTATATTTPIRFIQPTRFRLGAQLEHAVCQSLNQVGIPTDGADWLLLPGQPPEVLFRRAIAHLDVALQAQDFGAGYWSADLELVDDSGENGRYRLLISDVWATSAQAVTFRTRSVELQGEVVHLAAKNAGRRIVRLLAEAAATTLVPVRPESIH